MYLLEEKKYLYLLALIPLLGLLFLYNLYWQRKKQKEFGDERLIKKLSPDASSFKSILKFSIILLGLSGLVLALVNLKMGTSAETIKREGIDIVFAIDVSRSMLAEDVAPSRLEKSKQIVSQIINQLGSDRIGIVGYASSAYPVLPITSDYSMAKMFLQGMNTNMVSSQGTAIADAIHLSESFFDNPKTGRVIILVSDGEDHGEGSANIAQEARDKGIKIITIGVGTVKGGPIPLKEGGVTKSFKRDNNGEIVVTKLYPDQLKSIAEITKGKYIYGSNTKEVAGGIKTTIANIQKTEFESKQVAGFNSQYQWFAGFAFLLLFLDIFLLERKTAWIKKLNLFNEKES
jgi:Ca-activated chloride channel family protein